MGGAGHCCLQVRHPKISRQMVPLALSINPALIHANHRRPSLHDAPPSRMGASRSDRESTRIFRFESREGARCVGKTRAASGRPHAERLTDWSAAAHRHPEPAAVPAVAAVRLLFSVRRGEDEERRCTVKCWSDLISSADQPGPREEGGGGGEGDFIRHVRRGCELVVSPLPQHGIFLRATGQAQDSHPFNPSINQPTSA